jgi:predicted transposase YdaD
MFGLSEWQETQFYKDVKLEGLLEGEAKGKLEGLLEGEAKGKLEGLLEGKLKSIPGLLKLGLSPEQIATALELDLEIIQQEINRLSAN